MQDQLDSQKNNIIDKKNFVSTRIRDAEPDIFDPNVPRLGRRESEPHSLEVMYLYDVLSTNFPKDRTMLDLHHYFKKGVLDIDIQFDIAYFKDLEIPYTLSSYKASAHNNRIPTMAINILSKSTWRSDLAEKVDFCKILKIPLYVIIPVFHVSIRLYKPPFLRVYILQKDGSYEIKELHKTCFDRSGNLELDNTIDVSDIVPFSLGLQKQEAKKHQNEETLYRLVLINPKEKKLYLTKSQKIIEEKEKILEEKEKILEEKEKILEEKEKILEEKEKRITEQSEKIKRLESENLKLKERVQKKDYD